MSDRSLAIADEAIRQAREVCYGDANVGNKFEGDYGTWDDWRDMIDEVVERECEQLQLDLDECRRLLREALADMEGGGWFEVGPKSNWAIAAREAAGGTDG